MSEDRIFAFDREAEELGRIGRRAYARELAPSRRLDEPRSLDALNPNAPINRARAIGRTHHGKTFHAFTCAGCLRKKQWAASETALVCQCGHLHTREFKPRTKRCALCSHAYHLYACKSCKCPE